MLDIRSTYGTDSNLENSGKRIDISPTAWVLVARDGNKNFNALFAKGYQEQKFIFDQKNDASEAAAQALTIDVMAQTILVGWGGDIGIDGQVLDYSVENAKLLLAVKDFREFIQKQSKDFSNYKLAVAEATAKN